MTARCPHGHQSLDTDWCSECGTAMAPAAAGPPADPLDETEHTDTIVSAVTLCPNPGCGFPVAPGDRFCEECGHDVTQPYQGGDDALLVLVVSADRDAFHRLAPEGVRFPEHAGERVFELVGDEVLVGRADAERGVEPDIDLGAATGDPGVSRRHAKFGRDADGAWTITDLDSANGTWRNDDPDPIPPGEAVRIVPGDRVQIGAFSVLELRRA